MGDAGMGTLAGTVGPAPAKKVAPSSSSSSKSLAPGKHGGRTAGGALGVGVVGRGLKLTVGDVMIGRGGATGK